ncbi:TOBE domain-containing protein, partial [Mesorhizobium sp. M2E.F.Ca.ET.209.01.1.1]
RPATRFSATFMGESTILAGTVTEAKDGIVTASTAVGPISLPGASPAGAKIVLAVRPEHLVLGEAKGDVALGTAKVDDVVFQGSFKRVLATSALDAALQFIAKTPAST